MTAADHTVLQLVGARLGRGGVLDWLQAVEPRVRDDFGARFLYGVGPDGAGRLGEIVEIDGSAAVALPSPARPQAFARHLRSFLSAHPEISIVHSHLHHWGGIALRAAEQASVPVRIAHSHNSFDPTLHRMPKVLHLPFCVICRALVSRHATDGLGVSAEACVGLFGPRWQTDPRWSILHCGISLDTHELERREAAGRDLRRSWGVADEATVVGVIGRFAPAKNHLFALRVASELVGRDPAAWHVVFIGDGELRSVIDAEIAARRLERHVTLTGWHGDVLGLLRGAIDVVAAPSLHEGLPLALLTAQFAGRPVVASTRITRETIVVDDLCSWVELEQSPAVWADAVQRVVAKQRRLSQVAAFRDSSFDAVDAANALGAFYRSRVRVACS